MFLEQMTMFRVRGERVRIKKSSPIAREPARAETMTWKCGACGHAWRDLRECKGVCRAGCPQCGSRNIIDCNVEGGGRGERPALDARRGQALLDLALWTAAVAIAVAVVLGVIRGRTAGRQVERLAAYPDPVCERCGRALDGSTMECVEEGERVKDEVGRMRAGAGSRLPAKGGAR